jgi:hypothetical protein
MLEYRRTALLLGLVVAASVLACTVGVGGGEASKPVVEVLSPPSGSRVEVGEEVTVQFRAVDEVGVTRVHLEADGVVMAVERSSHTGGEPSMTATLSWTPREPGSHTLLLYAYNKDGAVSDPVGVSITVVPPSPASVAPTSTLAPAPPTPTLVPALPTATGTPVPPTPAPPTQTGTPVPPTAAPATPTATSVPPTRLPSTATSTTMSCPAITINAPSTAWPSRNFTLEWDSNPHPLPSGCEWGIRYKGNGEDAWTYLQVPLDPAPREEGGHWKADQIHGRGAEETLHYQVCLVSIVGSTRTFQCCGPVPPWPIIHTR